MYGVIPFAYTRGRARDLERKPTLEALIRIRSGFDKPEG